LEADHPGNGVLIARLFTKGRRSRVRRVGYGPSVAEQIVLAYLPAGFAVEGTQILVEYFGEHLPLTVRSTDRRSIFDPNKERLRGRTAQPAHA